MEFRNGLLIAQFQIFIVNILFPINFVIQFLNINYLSIAIFIYIVIIQNFRWQKTYMLSTHERMTFKNLINFCLRKLGRVDKL